MSEIEWSGWSDGQRKALHVGPLPGRKSICLYVVEGSVLDVLAYFRSEEEAAKALRWLRWLAGAVATKPDLPTLGNSQDLATPGTHP